MLNIDKLIKYIRLVEEGNEFDITLYDWFPDHINISFISTNNKKLEYYLKLFRLFNLNIIRFLNDGSEYSILIRL